MAKFPALPDPMPPLNSPEYVQLAKQIAIQTGAAQKAPRSFFIQVKQRAENKYRRLLNDILRQIDLKIASCTDPAQIPSLMQSIINSPKFDALCTQAAQQMATILAVGQKASWREAARASGEGRAIYKALLQELSTTSVGPAINAIVQQNAALIKTVPQTVARRFSDLAKKRRFQGIRPDEILQEMQQQAPHLREFEASRIARTESAKASTALIKARSQDIGLEWYIWHSVKDKRSRTAHKEMDGVLCRWSDPPNPEQLFPAPDGHNSGGCYDPGCIYNCRCSAFPVTKIERLTFPVKVHVSGHIENIKSLKAFRTRFDLPQPKGE